MTHSIKRQIAFIFIGLLTGTLVLCWFINNTFLVDYYVLNKKNTLRNAYYEINEASSYSNTDWAKFAIQFEKIYSAGNIDVVVIDASGSIKISSIYDGEVLKSLLVDYILDRNNKNGDIFQVGDNYIMQKTTDARTNIEYMEMWGILNNGNLFIMRTAMESIKDSVAIANRFLAYVGFFAVIVGAVVIWIVTKRITDPILELADISKRMTHLDFEVKYKAGQNNEIGVLGTHINQLSETLETTISELKSANIELQKDIEQKNQIDEMRKEFLSNISHELKTPIALIQGYAEGLKEVVNEDEESKDFYCDVIMDESSKMNKMVKKLLTLNQIEFGKDQVSMERFDIIALIKGIIQSSNILIKQKGAQIILQDYDPVYVWADEFKVEEVITNYFSNALNHLDNEKKIEVKVTEKEFNVRVSVFNTGKPIPDDALEHIWTKFYKVDKARTREYGGSGIGLSIVKAIMESFNKEYGVINYENGVEFWFELDK